MTFESETPNSPDREFQSESGLIGRLRTDYFPQKPVWTPEIDRKIHVVLEWIKCDLPGSHIWGLQRIGKSEFARYLVHVMPALLDGCAIAMVWCFLGCKPKNAQEVLGRCLINSGCKAISSRNQSILQDRLVQIVVAKCRAARATRVLIMLDELQNVPSSLYDVFMSVSSDLVNEGLTPHLLSIGQPEMRQTVKTLFDNNELQTVGRLFPTTKIYRGLSIEDVENLLKNMDGEEHALSASYFPERAAEGWCIADLIAPIYQAVQQMLVEKNLTATPRLPLGYLRPTLNRIFNFLADDPNAVVDEATAFECFKFSGLPKVIGHYVDHPQV